MKNKKNILNIVIVALNERFCKNVATSLANNLDMFVADCHEMIVYDLINPKDVIDKCGIEYFKKRERGVIKNCFGYSNTVLSINYELVSEYQDLLVNSLVIYLRLQKDKVTKVPNKIDYEHRDEQLINISDLTIELEHRSLAVAVKTIMGKIGELYENI